MQSRYRVSPPPDSTSGWLSSPSGETPDRIRVWGAVPSLVECKSPEEPVMHLHTVRFEAGAKRVEIYRHKDDMFDGDPLILIDADLEWFGTTPEGMEQLATWLGRIVLSDNPAVRKAVGIG